MALARLLAYLHPVKLMPMENAQDILVVQHQLLLQQHSIITLKEYRQENQFAHFVPLKIQFVKSVSQQMLLILMEYFIALNVLEITMLPKVL